MATFAYSGRSRAGQSVAGERIAETMEAAISALRREQIQVTQITPVKEKAAKKTKAKGASAKDLAVFTRQFSVMIGAGLPLVQCLDILGTQAEDKNFGAVILATRADVENGMSLADAMKKHPKAFDELFTNMIAAGEAGGILDAILKRLATYIEKAVKLKGQVKSAMVYPIAVVVIATWSSASSSGRSSRRSPRSSRGWAPNCRCRPVSSLPSATGWSATDCSSSPASSGLGFAFHSLLRDVQRTEDGRPDRVEAAGARPSHAEDCRRPVLPDLVHLALLGRLHSRGARHHGQDGRERHRRGCDLYDPEEHRRR